MSAYVIYEWYLCSSFRFFLKHVVRSGSIFVSVVISFNIIYADVIRFAFFIGTSLFRSWLLFLSQIFNFGSLIYIFITTDLRYFLGFSIFLGSGLLFSGALDLFYLFSLGCFLGLSIFLGSGLRLFRSNFIRDFGFRGDRSSITLCCTFRRLVFNICFCCKGQLISECLFHVLNFQTKKKDKFLP